MLINRRQVMAGVAGAASLLATPVIAASPPHVVVLGGGAGGATAALFLKRLAGERVRVTLIEENRTYHTCFGSNLVLGGLKDFAALAHGYDRHRDHAIDVIVARAERIDPDGRTVRLAGGDAVTYDRLIVSPGVSLVYDAVQGYSEAVSERLPHAWKAGKQTEILKSRIEAVDDGGSVVMVVPDNPYRCPPGPYERASMIAHRFKTTGRPGARVVLLDAKEKFSKQAVFQEAWERHYPGMVEWLPPSVHGGLERVDADASAVVTMLDTFTADLVNVIPPQKAGAIALESGLAGPDGWCPVDAATMRSTIAPDIHVIGDSSSAGDMPKSAFSANSQAKLAAACILADLFGEAAPEPRYFNTCWSLVAPDDAVKVGALYGPVDGTIRSVAGFVSAPGEAADDRLAAVHEAADWYTAITNQMFG